MRDIVFSSAGTRLELSKKQSHSAKNKSFPEFNVLFRCGCIFCLTGPVGWVSNLLVGFIDNGITQYTI